MRRKLSWAAGAAAALLAVGMTSCAAIPTSGPVEAGGVVAAPQVDVAVPEGPLKGEVPVGIVKGFINAAAMANEDDFKVARDYLTGDARTSWDPRKKITVYTPLRSEFRPSDDTVRVQAAVTGTIDETGRYVESGASNAREDFVFELTKNADGEYRIKSLSDGMLISSTALESAFRSVPLYFLSPDKANLVPEQRWFPAKSAATSAVEQLLQGPSATMRDATVTAIPSGTRLAVESVPVKDGVASVSLTKEFLSADDAEQALAYAQLTATLTKIAGVTTVNVSIESVPKKLELPKPSPAIDPEVGTTPYVVVGNAIQTLLPGGQIKVAGLAPLDGLDPTGLAVSRDLSQFAVRSGSDTVVALGTDGAPPRVVMTGSQLTSPCIDRFGWVWSTPRDSSGGITVAGPQGPVTLAVQGSESSAILALVVSRDGTRAAVVTPGSIDIVGIVRDPLSGAPLSLNAPERVGASVEHPQDVVWLAESSLAVLGNQSSTDDVTTSEVALSGPSRTLSVITTARSLAAGKGDRLLYLLTSDHLLYNWSGYAWTEVGQKISAAAFPG